MTVWFNGHYIPKEEVHISPDDRGFLFADGVYEVIRTYGRRPFRLADHVARLERSLRELRIASDFPTRLPEVFRELLARNTIPTAEVRLYVQITRGAAPRSHRFPPPGTPATEYAALQPLEPDPDAEQGYEAILTSDARWGRCDIKSIGLLPNVLALQEAIEAGAHEAILVRDGVVTEGTHTNVFAVFDGVVATAPLSGAVLPGVTRQVVLELCAAAGIPVEQGPISARRILEADEVFLTGTGAEVTPVVRVDGKIIGDGGPGPMVKRLRQAFAALVASGRY